MTPACLSETSVDFSKAAALNMTASPSKKLSEKDPARGDHSIRSSQGEGPKTSSKELSTPDNALFYYTGSNDPNVTRVLATCSSDVLLGRGKPFQCHAGNQKMLDLVDAFRDQYFKAERKGKHTIVEEVMRIIKFNGGRFLSRVDYENYWVEVSHSIAYRKVGHAFRSKARVASEKKGRPSINNSTARLLMANASRGLVGSPATPMMSAYPAYQGTPNFGFPVMEGGVGAGGPMQRVNPRGTMLGAALPQTLPGMVMTSVPSPMMQNNLAMLYGATSAAPSYLGGTFMEQQSQQQLLGSGLSVGGAGRNVGAAQLSDALATEDLIARHQAAIMSLRGGQQQGHMTLPMPVGSMIPSQAQLPMMSLQGGGHATWQQHSGRFHH